VLAGVIYDAYNALVKADDFNELKEIVRRLAEAQERTDQRVAELARSAAADGPARG
jgi:tetrahydromethanopterin S-methyltransferase subunit G